MEAPVGSWGEWGYGLGSISSRCSGNEPNETRRWKNSRTLSQRKNFNKVPAKALFSLVPVFKCKWFFQDLKNKTYSQN